MATEPARPAARHQPWYKILYVQVLIAIALGVLVGRFHPDFGKELKPLGDGFIALIKMMIAPVIFCTVVHGISSMGDLKRVGRVGLKALIYFEVVSTMAFTVGAYGLNSLWNLFALIATFYLTSILFVLIVLGSIARISGFSIIRFILYIKDELLIVLGTSSSETVLPQMMQKMEYLGASRSVVGLVIPTGYSFNLDGTNIYMTLATLFPAQATNTHLTIWQELG